MRRLAALLLVAGCGSTEDGLVLDAADVFDLGTRDLNGVPPSFTSSVALHVEPDEGLAPLLTAIRGAKTTIQIEMYLFTNSQLLDALRTARANGVSVQVILEPKPIAGSNAAACTALACTWADPAYRLTHAKTMLIDSQHLWVMTMNFTDAAVSGNREYLLDDTDPVHLAEAAAIFQADKTRTTSTAAELVVAPDNARSKLDWLISNAAEELDIEWEELSDNDLVARLGERLRAGLTVKIVVPTTIRGTATETAVRALSASGAAVRQLARPVPHAKLILSDRARGFIGSVNGTTSSISYNREVGVLWSGQTTADRIGRTFDDDFAAGSPL